MNQPRRRRSPQLSPQLLYSQLEQKDVVSDIELCEVGSNAVDECSAVQGTQSQLAATTNLAKCICGAGSFALPHVFLQQGLLGGICSLTLCGGLAAYTMISLADSTALARAASAAAAAQDNTEGPTSATISSSTITSKSNTIITSYVQLADEALGQRASQLVFSLTLSAALGVCSTYLVFMGDTMASLSMSSEDNLVALFFPGVSATTWQVAAAFILIPLSLIRDYSMFAWTSLAGVVAVVGGMGATLGSGILVDPGWEQAVTSLGTLRLWPTSLAQAFGTSFGTIAYLFCVNFLTFPILNSMKEPTEYAGAVSRAVSGVWFFNVIFAIGCLAFYGDDTQDLVLGNLGNGPYLSALKLFLCVDLLFTFPIVFSSGRQILENALLERPQDDDQAPQRALIVTGAVAACLGLAQIGGFGAVANLVGGVAQGTLAFVLPPAIAITLARREGDSSFSTNEIGDWAVGAFGVVVVSAVTYFTLESMVV